MFNTVFFSTAFVLFLLGCWFFFGRNFFSRRKKTRQDHHLIMQQIEKVFKVVLAEGVFNEIIDFRDESKKFFGLVSSTKKSLLVAEARVMMGFDFKKASIELDQVNRRVHFSQLPVAEIISMETDFKFYDINNGMFNKFKSEDYTQLLQAAKEHIKEKVEQSELAHTAYGQLHLLIEQISSSNGYTLNKTDQPKQTLIAQKNESKKVGNH